MIGSDDEHARRVEQEATEWLARLRAGHSQDQQAFEDWYASDVAHADAYDHVLRSWDATRRASDTPLGRARHSQSPGQSGHRRFVRASIAAVIVVTLMGVAIAALGLGIPGSSAAYAFETGKGEIRTLRLADGSQLTLDTDSAVRATFTPGQRRIRLVRGRARFDVARDPGRPFVVETRNGIVAAEASNMDVGLDSGGTTVTIWRGEANVRDAFGVRHIAMLAAGQSLELDRHMPAVSPKMAHAADARWASGMLSFENAPLADVITAANRYAKSTTLLSDGDVSILRFTGTFKATDTVGLAHMLAAMFHLKCDQSRAGKIVLSRSR